MGVYIKGMEMPGNCKVCPIKYYDDEEDCCPFVGDSLGSTYRPDDCPLVPVPSHGDLIDYEFCMKNYELLHDDDGNPVYAVRMRDINSAPTIIPEEYETEVPR